MKVSKIRIRWSSTFSRLQPWSSVRLVLPRSSTAKLAYTTLSCSRLLRIRCMSDLQSLETPRVCRTTSKSLQSFAMCPESMIQLTSCLSESFFTLTKHATIRSAHLFSSRRSFSLDTYQLCGPCLSHTKHWNTFLLGCCIHFDAVVL